MENMDSVNGNNRKSREDREAAMRERKIRGLENADTIFILPFGNDGFALSRMVLAADKCMVAVKKQFGLKLGIEEAKGLLEEFDCLTRKIWEYVYTVSPNLHSINPKNWRRINDSMEVKKVLADRRASYVVEPRCEESAMLAMAIKILQVKSIEVRQSSGFDELERFVSMTKALGDELDALLTRISAKLEIKYRSEWSDITSSKTVATGGDGEMAATEGAVAV